jgi:hypothetical protein
MSQETLEVQGTVQPDGSLVLDEKLNLPAGRVRVTVQTRSEPDKVDPNRFLAMMERIWADQNARGHVPRSREEIDAEINQLRDEAEEEMQATERLHEECQRARQQSPEQAP